MRPQPPSPWRLGDVMSVGATLVMGLTAILVAWIGVSGEPAPARQTGWLNVGIGGLVVAGIGTAVWLMTGRRAVGERRRQLLPDLALPAPSMGPDAIAEDAPAETLVVLPGMTRFHRSTCEFVTGKRATPVGRRRRRSAVLSPCGVCQPRPLGDGA